MTRILALIFGSPIAGTARFVLGSPKTVCDVSAEAGWIDDDSRDRLPFVLRDADR